MDYLSRLGKNLISLIIFASTIAFLDWLMVDVLGLSEDGQTYFLLFLVSLPFIGGFCFFLWLIISDKIQQRKEKKDFEKFIKDNHLEDEINPK